MLFRDYLDRLSSLKAGELLLSSDRVPLYRSPTGLLPLPGTTELPAEMLERELAALLCPEELRTLEREQHVACIKQLCESHRVRVSCHVAAHGYTLKLALADLQAQADGELAVPAMLSPLMHASRGLIIVAGPAASGKSSLVSRMLEQLCSDRAAFAMTVEDPVLYSSDAGSGIVVQRAVGKHCVSHAQGIDTALAARAEIIACSDLAAPGAFERMVEAASSGAVAIGELRAQSAVGALEQLLSAADGGSRSALAGELADALLAVLSLDLLPAQGGGRVPAIELLSATPRICALLREQQLDKISALFEREPGMQSMDRSLLELASAGLVEGREAYLRASDKALFRAWA